MTDNFDAEQRTGERIKRRMREGEVMRYSPVVTYMNYFLRPRKPKTDDADKQRMAGETALTYKQLKEKINQMPWVSDLDLRSMRKELDDYLEYYRQNTYIITSFNHHFKKLSDTKHGNTAMPVTDVFYQLLREKGDSELDAETTRTKEFKKGVLAPRGDFFEKVANDMSMARTSTATYLGNIPCVLPVKGRNRPQKLSKVLKPFFKFNTLPNYASVYTMHLSYLALDILECTSAKLSEEKQKLYYAKIEKFAQELQDIKKDGSINALKLQSIDSALCFFIMYCEDLVNHELNRIARKYEDEIFSKLPDEKFHHYKRQLKGEVPPSIPIAELGLLVRKVLVGTIGIENHLSSTNLIDQLSVACFFLGADKFKFLRREKDKGYSTKGNAEYSVQEFVKDFLEAEAYYKEFKSKKDLSETIGNAANASGETTSKANDIFEYRLENKDTGRLYNSPNELFVAGCVIRMYKRKFEQLYGRAYGKEPPRVSNLSSDLINNIQLGITTSILLYDVELTVDACLSFLDCCIDEFIKLI